MMPDDKYRIRAVLFDIGETLLSFGRVNISRCFAEGAHLSYDFLQNCGQPVGSFLLYYWRNLLAIRLQYLFSRITGKDFDSLMLLKKINSKRGIRLSNQQWHQFGWLWYEPLSRAAKIEQHLKQTLTELKNTGLKLGILSNTFINKEALEKHLAQMGIRDFFTICLYSYEFEFRKPDARIFKAAAERIGEKPENIMFVGDRIDKDIKPTVKLGMKAVLKTAYTNIKKKIPEDVWKINRLSELPPLIRNINQNK